MVSRYFPDNSVVCHARRLAGFKQDVFVSGASLGVNLQHPDLSFFADIYNEDWFFFARHAARRAIPKIGEVRQLEYDPFADPERAAREEFGDLLAEGLYAAFERRSATSFEEQLAIAMRTSYWQDFKGIRLKTIDETAEALPRVQPWVSEAEYNGAKESLRIAKDRAERISPDLCVDFIVNWQEDERRWQKMLGHFPQVMRERDALAELQLPRWISCGYGLPAGSETDLASAGVVLQ
jgi:hypothetical protein